MTAHCADAFLHATSPVLWVKYTQGDSLWADLLYNWHAKDVYEYWQLIAKGEACKGRWFEWWEECQDELYHLSAKCTPRRSSQRNA